MRLFQKQTTAVTADKHTVYIKDFSLLPAGKQDAYRFTTERISPLLPFPSDQKVTIDFSGIAAMSSSFLSHLIFSLIASQNIETAEQFHAKFFIQTDRSELRLEALEYIKEALQPKPD